MMDGGRLGPAVRAFRHSPPPSALPGDLLAPSAEQRRAAPGAEPGRLPSRTPRRWRRGVSGGEEGRTGRAEGPAAGWGQRRGQRSHWHAAPAPPPRRAGSAGAQRAPPSIPPSQPPGDGAFPLPDPGWVGGCAARWAGGGPEP